MILFLAFSIPVSWLFLVLARWERELSPDRLAWFMVFLRGVLSGIAGFVVLALLRSIVGFHWRPRALLFVSVLLADHLAPLLLAVGGMILLLRRVTAGHRGAALFPTVSSFLCGWFTVSAMVETVASWGRGDHYALIVLPLLRIPEIVAVSFLACRFHPWMGREGILTACTAAVVSLVAAIPSFLYDASRRGLAAILAVVAFLVALLYLVLNFPRVFLEGDTEAASGTAGNTASGTAGNTASGTAGNTASGAPPGPRRTAIRPAGRQGPVRRA